MSREGIAVSGVTAEVTTTPAQIASKVTHRPIHQYIQSTHPRTHPLTHDTSFHDTPSHDTPSYDTPSSHQAISTGSTTDTSPACFAGSELITLSSGTG